MVILYLRNYQWSHIIFTNRTKYNRIRFRTAGKLGYIPLAFSISNMGACLCHCFPGEKCRISWVLGKKRDHKIHNNCVYIFKIIFYFLFVFKIYEALTVCVCFSLPHASLSLIEYLKCHWNTLPCPFQFVGLWASPAAGLGEVTCYLIITYLNSIAIQALLGIYLIYCGNAVFSEVCQYS